MPLPLEGLRILSVSQFGAGPFATLMLADLGAEVIKIEDPKTRGDVSRSVPPFQIEDDSLYFQSFNRNKRSLLLNLEAPEGKVIFHRLVKISDAVFNNLRGDVPERIGLTYESLCEHNPAIVCCSLSAFGRSGPQATLPGYDYLVQASAGYMSITGDPNAAPAKCGVSVIDFAAGFAAALGLIAGIFSSRKTGKGCDVDVSLQDTALSMLNYLAIWYLNRGLEPRRLPDSAHAVLVPCQNFKTKDGYLAIFCAKEKFWQQLCQAIERVDLLNDARFQNFDQRFQYRDILIPILEQVFASKTNAEWMKLVAGKVPCAPVRTVAAALDDPLLAASGMIVEVSHPIFGKIRQIGCPIKVSSLQYRPAPGLGEDTEAILRTYLSLSDEQIANFRGRGIAG
jgi:crotonobetainyl-CoA:carnitine CoA-transferase CaiB-like acyl-CoA transferase